MKELTSIHYLRALSMLYIVGYWHLFDYSSAEFGHSSAIIFHFTNVVLALFVFVSGFLIGGRRHEPMTVWGFYKKRLLRIYPLYVLALGLFYVYGINDAWVSVKALFGVSMFYQPAPLTLWFITMLLVFYLLAPLLLALVKNTVLFIAVTSTIFCATLLFKVVGDTLDPRILLYFPGFCLGIFCAYHGLANKFMNVKLAVIGLVAGIGFMTFDLRVETLNILKGIPVYVFGCYLIFYMVIKREEQLVPYRWISFLSYSSFAMYLFHRLVYTTLIDTYFPEHPWWQIAYLMTVGVALAALVSWTMQKAYDRCYSAVGKYFKPPERVAL